MFRTEQVLCENEGPPVQLLGLVHAATGVAKRRKIVCVDRAYSVLPDCYHALVSTRHEVRVVEQRRGRLGVVTQSITAKRQRMNLGPHASVQQKRAQRGRHAPRARLSRSSRATALFSDST